jgi:hypothetical protein
VAALVAVVVGLALFLRTISTVDREAVSAAVARLGHAWPLVLAPSLLWHGLRTWGWALAFPDTARPTLGRLARVRLAADALSFFTVRGPTGEPLKVLLLSDTVPPAVTTAAIAAERLAFAVVSMVVAALVSQLAVRRLVMTPGWDFAFTALSVLVTVALGIGSLIARRGTGTLLARWDPPRTAATPSRRSWTTRVVRFVAEVERHLLGLLRGQPYRLGWLAVLPVVCYLVNAAEVWLIFRLIGEPIGPAAALVIETFVRLASIAGAAVPASIGTLEASHVAIASALGLSGGVPLAFARRLRAMLWAGLGLAVYPRLGRRRSPDLSGRGAGS